MNRTYSRRQTPDNFDPGFFNAEHDYIKRAIYQSMLANEIDLRDYDLKVGTDHDDTKAFTSALNDGPVSGVSIVIPATKTNIFNCAQSLHLVKPTRLSGSLSGQPTPAGPVGTAVYFSADQTGLFIENRDSFGDTFAFPNTRSTAGLGGAEFSIIEHLSLFSRGGITGFSSGGTGLAVDALRIRAAQVKFRNLWIDGWTRNGVRLWATSGSADPSLNGNVNLWRADSITINRTGSDAFSVFGADANAGKATLCDFSVSNARGLYDGSLLGNKYDTVHFSGNLGRCIETDNVNARNRFIDCYLEGAGSVPAANQARIIGLGYVDGGQLASDGSNFTSDTTALIVTSDGRLVRKELRHINTKGTVSVAVSLGKDTATQTAMTLGSGDTNIPNEDTELHYDEALHKWEIRDNGNSGNAVIEWPNRLQLATLRAYTAGHKNGVYLGPIGTGMLLTQFGAMPASGTYQAGDIVQKSGAPTEAGGAGSKYIVSGWKRITSGSAHVLNTDWFEMRTLTGN